MLQKKQYFQHANSPQNRFNAIPAKIPKGFLGHNYKLILEFIQRAKSIRKAKTILKKNNQIGGLTLPYFKIYSKATAIKIVWFNERLDTQLNGTK